MADGVLFVGGQLGVAAALGVGALARLAHAAFVGDEQRVVAKAVVSRQPLKGDAAGALAHTGQMPAFRQDEADRRHELRAALPRRDVLHLLQEFVVVGLVVAVVAAVAGTVDAGGTVQRVHAQAGIVGDGGQPAGLADGLGLDEGIFFKGGAGLLRLDGDAKLLLADDLVALCLKDAPQLAELSGVAGGCADLHVVAPFLCFQLLDLGRRAKHFP